jgi:hypothetical protein
VAGRRFVGSPAAAFVGRESVLREMGFRPVAWPSTGRVIMRLDL